MAPPSPPRVRIPSPSPQPGKRKLPDFINTKGVVEKSEKRVRFRLTYEEVDQGIHDSSKLFESVEPIKEDSRENISDPEMNDSCEEKSMVELLKLEQMYDVFSKLNHECKARMRTNRLDAGEILEGNTPTTSQESENSNCSYEFELSESSAVDEVGPDAIFDFIWEYTTDHQQDIYSRIGTGNITRDAAESYLRNAPRLLLQILEVSLVEAERILNRFSA